MVYYQKWFSLSHRHDRRRSYQVRLWLSDGHVISLQRKFLVVCILRFSTLADFPTILRPTTSTPYIPTLSSSRRSWVVSSCFHRFPQLFFEWPGPLERCLECQHGQVPKESQCPCCKEEEPDEWHGAGPWGNDQNDRKEELVEQTVSRKWLRSSAPKTDECVSGLRRCQEVPQIR